MSSKLTTLLKDTFVPLPPSRTHLNDLEINNTELLNLNEDNSKTKKFKEVDEEIASLSDASTLVPQTQRRLKNRHVQLIGISGVIGTGLFVAIGGALYKSGPGFLLIGFTIWCIPILCITVSTAEMVCYLPISSPFIRMSGRCIDDAFEFMAGWNFWFLECVQIPYEIVGVNTIIHYWRDDYSPAITIAIQAFLYFLISIFAVKVYGETEFWLAIGKVILAVGLILFTIVTMCGGNPIHDAYGFRYWTNPGSFKEYVSTGSLGYFRAFYACLTQASYTIAGPDYLSMVAGETILPKSSTLPRAFKQIFYRLSFLFIGGAFCVGTIVANNDPSLTAAINESRPGAGSSPYVIAMDNLNVKVLPHIVNAALILSAFSAGNAYTYCSSRTLYGLALDHKAPKIFTWCNKQGVPILAVIVSLCWALISFLQLSENSAVVLNWLINLITVSQLFNFCVMCLTYLAFRRAVIVQGIDRDAFTFKSWFQPYTAIFGLVCSFILMWCNGYAVFVKGGWSVDTFLFNYLVIFVDVGLYIFWKALKRGKFIKSEEVDLISGLHEIEEHERLYLQDIEDEKRFRKERGEKERSFIRRLFDPILSLLVGKD